MRGACILSHLKALDGVAGFLLANGALGDSDTAAIREKLIRNDKKEFLLAIAIWEQER